MKICLKKSDLQSNILLFISVFTQFFFMTLTKKDFYGFSVEIVIKVSIAGLIYLVLIKSLGKRTNLVLIGYLLLTLFFAFASHLYNANINITGVINNVVVFAGTILMFNTKLEVFFGKLFFWFITLYFSFVYLINHSFDSAFVLTSRNYISVIYLFALAYIIIASRNREEFVNIIYFVIPLLFSFLAIGRGGILSCICLLILELFFRARHFGSWSKRWGYRLIILFLVFIIPILLSDYNVIRLLFSRFIDVGTSDEARNNIWTHYFQMVLSNGRNMLWGPSMDSDGYLAMFSGNAHNSLLNMHSRYGLLYTLLNIVLLVYASFWYLKNKKYQMFTILFVLVLRGMTDAVFGSYWGDMFFWFLVLYPSIFKIDERKKTIYIAESESFKVEESV